MALSTIGYSVTVYPTLKSNGLRPHFSGWTWVNWGFYHGFTIEKRTISSKPSPGVGRIHYSPADPEMRKADLGWGDIDPLAGWWWNKEFMVIYDDLTIIYRVLTKSIWLYMAISLVKNSCLVDRTLVRGILLFRTGWHCHLGQSIVGTPPL